MNPFPFPDLVLKQARGEGQLGDGRNDQAPWGKRPPWGCASPDCVHAISAPLGCRNPKTRGGIFLDVKYTIYQHDG